MHTEQSFISGSTCVPDRGHSLADGFEGNLETGFNLDEAPEVVQLFMMSSETF